MLKFLAILLTVPPLQAFPIEIDDNLSLEIRPEDSFESFVATLYDHLESDHFRIELAVAGEQIKAKATPASGRSYEAGLSDKNKEDVRYILRNLANSNLIKMGMSFSEMRAAGKRINAIHPLRFLQFVFSDDELKVCITNVQIKGGLPWSEFISGVCGSLEEEAEKGNLKPQQIKELARTIKVSPELIIPIIDAEQWEELVKTLIANVPRNNKPNKFDM